MTVTNWSLILVALFATYVLSHTLVAKPPQGKSRRSLAHWSGPLIIAAITIIGWGTAVTVSERMAFREHSESIFLAQVGGDTARYEWAVVIGRRRERSHTSDVEKPYRNSPLALYQRISGNTWEKREGDLLCRSTTTTSHPPRATDHEAVRSFASDRDRHYRWGHVSVPLGVFSLTPVEWRTRETAFLISELHSSDGTIALGSPQTLTVARAITAEATGVITVINDPDIDPIVSYIKQGCHIHPSFTRDWSHRDSLGCINLYHGQEEGQEGQLTDWATFFSWIEGRGLLDQPLALVVASFEELAGPGATALPDTLDLDEL
jgi:hypothetical protein